MLDLVDVGARSLESYRGVSPEHLLEELRGVAKGLAGARVLHVNATSYGGGVSELLRSEVPLLNDLGLVADWRIISGDNAFFQVTKAIHNALQGSPRALTDAQQRIFLANAEANARSFEEEYDFVFVHDPQPVALLPLRGRGHARWVWRCHIDTAHPNPQVWQFLRDFLSDYDAAIFTLADFVPKDLPIAHLELLPPAIDPLSPKNLALPRETSRQVLEWIGVRTDRPLVTQVSRFDPWKDPMGVLAAYRQVRAEFPGLQLALVGSLALDDPEGWDLYREVEAEARRDRSIHAFTNLVGVGNIEVNAFQALSDVVIQKSLREGFGLVVSEALWKGTPVVAGAVGGIPLQMADGVGGVLVDSVDACAEALASLLREPARARALGEAGRERVREHFLTPRLVLDHLRLMRRLAEARPLVRPPGWAAHRDPVCGMSLQREPEASALVGAVRYGFCSQLCRATFLAHPQRYLGSA
ncbi:MAG TPA: glycosyltransferase [Aggregicoccus sp.]|nr:glycosyltransferase [Aggregicoccus sp.]